MASAEVTIYPLTKDTTIPKKRTPGMPTKEMTYISRGLKKKLFDTTTDPTKSLHPQAQTKVIGYIPATSTSLSNVVVTISEIVDDKDTKEAIFEMKNRKKLAEKGLGAPYLYAIYRFREKDKRGEDIYLSEQVIDSYESYESFAERYRPTEDSVIIIYSTRYKNIPTVISEKIATGSIFNCCGIIIEYLKLVRYFFLKNCRERVLCYDSKDENMIVRDGKILWIDFGQFEELKIMEDREDKILLKEATKTSETTTEEYILEKAYNNYYKIMMVVFLLTFLNSLKFLRVSYHIYNNIYSYILNGNIQLINYDELNEMFNFCNKYSIKSAIRNIKHYSRMHDSSIDSNNVRMFILKFLTNGVTRVSVTKVPFQVPTVTTIIPPPPPATTVTTIIPPPATTVTTIIPPPVINSSNNSIQNNDLSKKRQREDLPNEPGLPDNKVIKDSKPLPPTDCDGTSTYCSIMGGSRKKRGTRQNKKSHRYKSQRHKSQRHKSQRRTYTIE